MDLAAHATARNNGDRPLVVAMTGSQRPVGTALAAFLTTAGHRVIRLVRRTRARHPTNAGGTRRHRPTTCCAVWTR